MDSRFYTSFFSCSVLSEPSMLFGRCGNGEDVSPLHAASSGPAGSPSFLSAGCF